MSAYLLTASLVQARRALDNAFSYHEAMPTWMKAVAQHMKDALFWMTEAQPSSTALCLRAAYGSICDSAPNTAPSPSE